MILSFVTDHTFPLSFMEQDELSEFLDFDFFSTLQDSVI